MKKFSICILIVNIILIFSINVLSQPVSDEYKPYFLKHNFSKTSELNSFLKSKGYKSNKGRSFALLLGNSFYPNMSKEFLDLSPAKVDLKEISDYLLQYEFFDEIILLENQNLNLENIEFFLNSYFPTQLYKNPNSRLLICFSGHGFVENDNGYILKYNAKSVHERSNSINMRLIKVLLDENVRAGHHLLFLFNSCKIGSIFIRDFGKAKVLDSSLSGAHIITAGAYNETVYSDPIIGDGSVFFEFITNGLKHEYSDLNKDGMTTTCELFTFLRTEIRNKTEDIQHPTINDLKRGGSAGEFYFYHTSLQKNIDKTNNRLISGYSIGNYGGKIRKSYKLSLGISGGFNAMDNPPDSIRYLNNLAMGFPLGLTWRSNSWGSDLIYNGQVFSTSTLNNPNGYIKAIFTQEIIPKFKYYIYNNLIDESSIYISSGFGFSWIIISPGLTYYYGSGVNIAVGSENENLFGQLGRCFELSFSYHKIRVKDNKNNIFKITLSYNLLINLF